MKCSVLADTRLFLAAADITRLFGIFELAFTLSTYLLVSFKQPITANTTAWK